MQSVEEWKKKREYTEEELALAKEVFGRLEARERPTKDIA